MFYCRYSYDWGEVMNSFDSMKTKLESTGLYKVTAKSNIRAELLAYAEGLNTEFDMLETMERELFIDTAENCGITERERFVGKINADYPLEKLDFLFLKHHIHLLVDPKCNSESL